MTPKIDPADLLSASPPSRKAVPSALPRPLLSRDADAVYWMARYVERSEHLARVLMVNSSLLVDVGDLDADLQDQLWNGVLTIMHLDPLAEHEHDGRVDERVGRFMTFSPENPNSLLQCITRGRENARGIRVNISAEMWECLNSLYWNLRSPDAQVRFEESPSDIYQSVINGSMLFQGQTDQTLPHDQAWHFAQLGKWLERLVCTARIMQSKFMILRAAEDVMEPPVRNIHWMAVLRSCCSIEHYRRSRVGELDYDAVAEFLLLEPDFPRSIRHVARQAHCMIREIRRQASPVGVDRAERILGRLDAELEYADMGEIISEGLGTMLQRLQDRANEAAAAVQRAYFLH